MWSFATSLTGMSRYIADTDWAVGMARKELAMEAKLLAVFSTGVSVPVTELCAELGISRQSFYKYRRRYAAEGPPGLVARSTRPCRSPQLIDAALEDEIVRLRKELPLDNGARTIGYHLQRDGRWPVPSIATIHRALVRRGLVVAQPHKAPPSKGCRFEFPAPNAAWQIDATQWALTQDRVVWVMDVIDDHSRLMVASVPCWGPTGRAAWDALCIGAARWGLPARVMSDNGSCFTSRFLRTTGEADFERDLRALGIAHLLSSPGHPQTCGKIERQHQTLKAWLATHRRARTLPELQRQLDGYLEFYNHQRPHSALGGATPHERWTATEPERPDPPIPLPSSASLHTVDRAGRLHWGGYEIGIGQQLAGHELLVIARDLDLTIIENNHIIRRLTIDPTRSYQPSGRPPGRPPKPRH
jgi:transposase InsO family protein